MVESIHLLNGGFYHQLYLGTDTNEQFTIPSTGKSLALNITPLTIVDSDWDPNEEPLFVGDQG